MTKPLALFQFSEVECNTISWNSNWPGNQCDSNYN